MKVWTTLLASALGAITMAQGSLVLYAPVKAIKDQQISVRGWGSGTVSETDEAAYEGTNSIRISTRNYFQGGSIVFGNPVNLAGAFADKNNLLRLVFQPIERSTTFGGAGGGLAGAGGPGRGGGGLAGAGGAGGGGAAGGGAGAPGGGKGGAGGGAPGGLPGGATGPGGIGRGGGLPGGATGGQGRPGGFPGAPGGLQGGGFPGAGAGAAAANNDLKVLRFIVTTTDGKRSEAYVPVTSSSKAERGWKSIAVPLQAISGFDRTNKVVKEISFAGDTTTSFFVGELKIVNDTTPLTAEPNYRDLNLALGQEVTFTANGSGGASILKYTWDFNAADGVAIDSEGQVVKHKFRKAGTYTVTLTVSDENGLKTPYSTTIKITVNP